MSLERVKEIHFDFQKAVTRLAEALAENLDKGSIVIDGTIQRFEFSFELAWKTIKAVLDYNGVEATTPRAAIKEAFVAKMIDDGEAWIEMLEDRNKTSHIYDEKQAIKIYRRIKDRYYKLLDHFAQFALTYLKKTA
ncbi:MAG: nucleotidyltransferase [Candidatus Omnitrophica bacterium]|nr:nucleotidyltransferase [Candidatus Omnitrophota bacterium]